MVDETHFCICHHEQGKHTEMGTCTITGCNCTKYVRDADRDRRLGDQASLADILYGTKFRIQDHINKLSLTKPNSPGQKDYIFADLQKDELVLYRSLSRVRGRIREYSDHLKDLNEIEKGYLEQLRLLDEAKDGIYR
jgi:hypothetical protein